LQYHFFYAFNDWRQAANGTNQHEGDWEAVAIFLKKKNQTAKSDKIENYKPFGVACSQHEQGEFRFWKDVKNESMHPVIYVALGSHANYFEAENYPTSMQFSGFLRTLLSIIERPLRWLGGGDVAGGLPKEYVERTCCNIGPDQWHCVWLDDAGWVEYRGLWGQKEGHEHESGPTGPKWERAEPILDEQGRTISFRQKVRPRWGLHEWKDELLLKMALDNNVDSKRRRKAFKALVNR
jgi:hypothetical protein